MILGSGIDMVDVRRIESLLADAGERFVARIFTPRERLTCDARKERAASYAKRFAAKEACAKALGCGIGQDALFADIEVVNDERGAPALVLHGAASKRLQEITPPGHQARLFLALTDEIPYAVAQVMIEARKK